ncbi:ABC transporter ATP-binding protein [bacterium]|nr:ABC transporter ATP-binding protein [bacterium]
MSELVIQTKNLKKSYVSGEIETIALKGVSVDIKRGEFTAIAGPSGSGKTTFLNIISGLDSQFQGEVTLAGKNITKISKSELSDFRRDHIGFVFQSYNLIPVLTVEENVEYIMLLQNIKKEERKERVISILNEVGLKGFEKRFPSQLSGGQQQRVAVARAIVSNPDIILADEPTANLDSKTGESLLEMMGMLNVEKNITFIFSTHDEKIMRKSKRMIVLKDGEIFQDNNQ